MLVSGVQHSDSTLLQTILHLKLLWKSGWKPQYLIYTERRVPLSSLPSYRLSCIPLHFLITTSYQTLSMSLFLLHSSPCVLFPVPRVSGNIQYISFLCLTYFTKHNTLQVHPCCSKCQDFIFFMTNSPFLYVHDTSFLSIHLLIDIYIASILWLL